MNVTTLRRCSVPALILAAGLVACSGKTTSGAGYTPQMTPLGALNFGVQPDAHCPKSDLACVTVSPPSGADVGLCVESGQIVTSCSGSPPTYTWSSVFYSRQGKVFHKLDGAFYPNPGDPTLDTITEATSLKSSHGKYKYYQLVKACASSGCLSAQIGVATE
ncbi:MAG TPA: hypothetical protein VKR56_10460 [Candidatus Cybelea sp.]|nr:hypothetical protein [Candidatus Cybelea sp.]